MGDSKHSKLLAPSYVLANLNCLFLDSVASMMQCIWYNPGCYTVSLESLCAVWCHHQKGEWYGTVLGRYICTDSAKYFYFNKWIKQFLKRIWGYLDILKDCRLQVGPLGSCGLNHGKGEEIFSFLQSALCPTQTCIQWVLAAVSLGTKQPGHEADNLVPRLRRSGVIPPLLHMPLRYMWEIFTFSYECLEALLCLASFGWWLHVSSMPASCLVISALRFWPGDWLSGLLSDFGQEIGF